MILQDKVALVTGGTTGIGRATAITLGAAGAKVVFSGRRDAEGEKTAKLIRETGRNREQFVNEWSGCASEDLSLRRQQTCSNGADVIGSSGLCQTRYSDQCRQSWSDCD
jgi:NAD(P)-dependent dehydrogenase (short-subunit alcohol dehydrogenase family)